MGAHSHASLNARPRVAIRSSNWLTFPAVQSLTAIFLIAIEPVWEAVFVLQAEAQNPDVIHQTVFSR